MAEFKSVMATVNLTNPIDFFWIGLSLWLAASTYFSFIAVALFIRLRVRFPLLVATSYWFILSFYIPQRPIYYASVVFLIPLLAALASIILALVFYRRERSSLLLLEKIPWKKQLIGRYPPNLLQGLLPPLPPPRLPPRASSAFKLLMVNGIMVLVPAISLTPNLMLILLIDLTTTVISMGVSSAFLFLSSALVWMKRYMAGGLLGVVFGVLTLGVLGFGILGIIGGVLALRCRREPGQESVLASKNPIAFPSS